jgi:hypothetical protein
VSMRSCSTCLSVPCLSLNQWYSVSCMLSQMTEFHYFYGWISFCVLCNSPAIELIVINWPPLLWSKSRMMLCVQTYAPKSIVFGMKEINDKPTISKKYYLACPITKTRSRKVVLHSFLFRKARCIAVTLKCCSHLFCE